MSNKPNAKSLGGALAMGIPVVFTVEDRTTEVICPVGKEQEALELLIKMKILTLECLEDLNFIKIVRPEIGVLPKKPVPPPNQLISEDGKVVGHKKIRGPKWES